MRLRTLSVLLLPCWLCPGTPTGQWPACSRARRSTQAAVCTGTLDAGRPRHWRTQGVAVSSGGKATDRTVLDATRWMHRPNASTHLTVAGERLERCCDVLDSIRMHRRQSGSKGISLPLKGVHRLHKADQAPHNPGRCVAAQCVDDVPLGCHHTGL